nr:MAG: hypothetical protein [Microvirus sp.]
MTEHSVGLAALPGSHQEAAQGLVDRGTADSISLSARTLKTSIEGVDPDLLAFSQALLKELKRRGIPFFPHCYVRSGADQDSLYAQGVSKARAGESPHNWGMAVDLVHFGRFWNLSKKEWAVIGLIGKEVARKRNLKIVWGGDWKFYDPAHWELKDWKARVTATMPVSFKAAFAAARARGDRVFTWKGQEYTTELA